MSACPFGLCDGSGERVNYEPEDGWSEHVPCPCAKRDTIPSEPDAGAALCLASGCEGCPACTPGYIP